MLQGLGAGLGRVKWCDSSLKEKGAFGRHGGEEGRLSAFPFLLADSQTCRASENQDAFLWLALTTECGGVCSVRSFTSSVWAV